MYMTIKEVETLTGITKANIRFYEKEGLLAPGRSSNNYREYSEDDVEHLRKDTNFPHHGIFSGPDSPAGRPSSEGSGSHGSAGRTDTKGS